MKKLMYFLPILAFMLMGVFLYRGIELDPAELPSPLVNKPFPQFSIEALDGKKVLSAQDLRGQVTLVNVWATWCVSCRLEHPYLLKLAGEGVRIVGLNYKDDSDEALQWLDKLGNPYVFNISDKQGTLGLDLGVFGAPETFLLDKDGIIRYKRVGVIDEQIWRTEFLPVYSSLPTN